MPRPLGSKNKNKNRPPVIGVGAPKQEVETVPLPKYGTPEYDEMIWERKRQQEERIPVYALDESGGRPDAQPASDMANGGIAEETNVAEPAGIDPTLKTTSHPGIDLLAGHIGNLVGRMDQFIQVSKGSAANPIGLQAPPIDFGRFEGMIRDQIDPLKNHLLELSAQNKTMVDALAQYNKPKQFMEKSLF